MTWTTLWDWLMGLGPEYGVNPIVFAGIYVGAIPFFMLSVARVVQNLRRKRSILPAALSASFFFISAYIYLLIAGRSIPLWVYGVIVFMIAGGIYSTLKKIIKGRHTTQSPSCEDSIDIDPPAPTSNLKDVQHADV